MPIKLNSQTLSGIIEEKLGHTHEFNHHFPELIKIGAAIRSLPMADINEDDFKLRINAAITSSISAGRRLLSDDCVALLKVSALSAFDRFAIAYFISAQLAFLNGLAQSIDDLIAVAEEQRLKSKTNLRAPFEGLSKLVDDAAMIELPYAFGVDPSTYIGEFLNLQAQVIDALLEAKSATWRSHHEQRKKIIEVSTREYVTWAESNDAAASIVNTYLNFKQQLALQNRVVDDVKGITLALQNWTSPANNFSERRLKAWQAYREKLIQLPDEKITMFDENFGVRKVFVQPLATYKVAGIRRDAEARVHDISALLGTLISERTEGDDLILLCGGPGSGKSTLCRILASELVQNEQIHPLFLRLRRLQDSREIISFIEDHLQREGLADKISDLLDVPNLVLILDGFDELVMASRSRLREFFNALNDDLSTGPLRHAKVIVSGRDTLFPKGAGLPTGAHVLSLLPFDKPRIAAWGEKWRNLHRRSKGSSFYPENLVSDSVELQKRSAAAPLEHLVSWPLTLHLVARAHTSGSIDLAPETSAQVEKAVLYRSIVADTALRQSEQSSGDGRLDSENMRRFVQAIAWEMYSKGREALDINEGLPILKSIFPDANEATLAELTDVTIVNQPELTKGDETGFEFVHKSFSEYFVAERMATSIEQVCFKSPVWGSREPTWRMSINEATIEMAKLFAIKLLTPEVQEMLEPMLGNYDAFRKNGNLIPSETEIDLTIESIEQKIGRIEILIEEYSGGGLLQVVSAQSKSSRLVNSDLEAYGNYASALLIIACSLSKRHNLLLKEAGKLINITTPNLLRLIHIILAGDISIDRSFATRAFGRLNAHSDRRNDTTNFPPIAPTFLDNVHGLRYQFSDAVAALGSRVARMEVENLLLRFRILLQSPSQDRAIRINHMAISDRYRRRDDELDYLRQLIGNRMRTRYDEHDRRYDRYHELELQELIDDFGREAEYVLSPQLTAELRSLLTEISREIRHNNFNRPYASERIGRLLEKLRYFMERR